MSAYKISLPVFSEDIMTLAQAADELGIHIATVYRWKDSGQLHAFRIGDQLVVHVDEVQSVKRQIENGELPSDKRGLKRNERRPSK